MMIYVLWWRYGDGSSMDVERVYTDRNRAEQDLKLLNDACTMKNFELKELEVTK